MVSKVISFGSALNGSTDSGVLKFQLLTQPLFTVSQLILSILIEFTLVQVEIAIAPIPPTESALWAVPTLLLLLTGPELLLLGSRWRAGGGRGRGGAYVGGQGVRGRRRRLRGAAGGRRAWAGAGGVRRVGRGRDDVRLEGVQVWAGSGCVRRMGRGRDDARLVGQGRGAAPLHS